MPSTSPTDTTTSAPGRWRVVVLLALGQFVMVLDGSVMNVSISRLVADLDTSVVAIQGAITAYTLVMAAFMLTGGKVGDLIGRRRAFQVGLGIYGVGSLLTALAPNLGVLLLGWSLIEGVGAVLVVPAIAALIAGNYRGAERGAAYGIVGGVAAAAVAVGPMIGGFVTTQWSWRWVFVAETVISLALVVASWQIDDVAPPRRDALDLGGAALSAIGFALVVTAILQSRTWGWVEPRRPPSVGGRELTVVGFAPTLPLLLAGVGVLWAFAWWERRREAAGRSVLVHLELLAVPQLRAGLVALLSQQVILAGTFFVLPLFLQVVLGLDAFQSGARLFPLSLAMFVAAMGGARLGSRRAPRRIVRAGLGVLLVALLVLIGVADPELASLPFALAMALAGAGVGLMASQLGNVIQSAVDDSRSGEAGGLQGTAQNLGSSVGTALVGAVLLLGLSGGFVQAVSSDPSLSPPLVAAVSARAEGGLDFVATDAVVEAATAAGVAPAAVETLGVAYSEAQIDALRSAFGLLALLVVVALLFTRQLPDAPLRTQPTDAGAEAVT